MIPFGKLLIVLMAVFAILTSAPSWAEEPGGTEFDIVITATGNSPDQEAFDGKRIFLLPVEMSTISPPDIEICLVQENGTYCTSGHGTTCPDVDRCEIPGLRFDATVPLGLVIYDYDGWGEEAIGGIADGVRAIGGLGELASQHNPLSQFSEQVNAAAGAVSGGFQSSAAVIEGTNAKRSEWMDAVILVPDGYVGETESIADLIRAQVREDSLPEFLSGYARRLEGRFQVVPVQDCTIAGLCVLAYSAIEIKLKEEINVQY